MVANGDCPHLGVRKVPQKPDRLQLLGVRVKG